MNKKECNHEMKQITIGFWSCDCKHMRYFPFQAVENLIHYFKWERGANKKQALEIIVNDYKNSKSLGNKTLSDIAQIRLKNEFF
jgi:hypothetical protein